MVAPLIGGAIALGVNYLAGQQQQSQQLQAGKAQAKALKGAAKARKLQAMSIPGKPRGSRSEGLSGSGVIPSADADVFPGLGIAGGDPFAGFGGFAPTGAGSCPGVFSVRIGGRCVNLGDLPPGGDPAVTGQVMGDGSAFEGFGPPVAGWYGIGITPRVESVTVSRCPPGFAIGKDGVCYEGLARSKRRWDPGMKPLLTGGDRAAIAKAARAARRLDAAKKGLRRSAKALGKAC